MQKSLPPLRQEHLVSKDWQQDRLFFVQPEISDNESQILYQHITKQLYYEGPRTRRGRRGVAAHAQSRLAARHLTTNQYNLQLEHTARLVSSTVDMFRIARLAGNVF